MRYTENYNLKKPEELDPVDIQDLNYNADVIDSKLKEVEDWKAAHLQASNPHSITPALIGAETPTGAQAKANAALAEAKSHAENVANSALNSAKEYADEKANQAETNAKNYADQVASDLSQKLDETRIKVLDVEQDVSNISKVLTNLNPNQEPKQKVNGYGIIPLPKNAANGQVSDVVVKGLTATNLVKNGSFEEELTDWTHRGVAGSRFVTDTDSYVGSKAFKIISAGDITQNISVQSTDKIYASVYFKRLSENTGAKILLTVGDNSVSTDNQVCPWTKYSVIGQNATFVRVGRYTNETGEYLIDGVFAVNLTQTFGAGNEPTVEECDQIFSNWFDGTKSTISAFRIRSVSEDESQESVVYVLAKDDEGNIEELRSLPNGVKDEVSVSEGKLIKRVSDEVVLQGSDFKHVMRNNINNDVASVDESIFVDIINPGTDTLATKVWTSRTTPRNGASFDSENNVWTHSFDEYNNMLIFLPKGLYADLSSVREDLAGTTLTYQLATPIEKPIQVSGSLVSYPSGTVYIEPFVADAGIYTDKMEVLYSDLPIKTLEKISKVDFATGLETELNITAAVIAEDKLSFTHPDLVDGDIVFFTYEYDRESTVGETEIEYYDSRYVIKDSVTGKFYKWHLAIADGVPSIELTEV